MDWKPIYRRDAEMLDLLGDWSYVSRAEIHRDPDHNIAFLKVYRRNLGETDGAIDGRKLSSVSV